MDNDVCLSLIVAKAQNGVIGRDNQLPWRLPKDLAYFKKITMGHPIIMGRKTFDSIGRALPGRTNIVVTRQKNWSQPGVEIAFSLKDALGVASLISAQEGLKEVMLIGGSSLYQQALPLASKLYITEVQADVPGDALFPEYNSSDWRELARESFKADDANPYDYAFVEYERVVSP